jgi:succinate dehydrogenase / fumarate reductase membrane anchor subunit
MRYLTPRKRAEGKGASGGGTAEHWYMTVTSVVLAFLVPGFIIVFGRALGSPRDEVLATFAKPWVAILTGLVLVVAMQHFWRGAQVMISDYWRGSLRKGLVILAISLAYLVIALGIFALARIAL